MGGTLYYYLSFLVLFTFFIFSILFGNLHALKNIYGGRTLKSGYKKVHAYLKKYVYMCVKNYCRVEYPKENVCLEIL